MIPEINIVDLYKRIHQSGYKTEPPADFGPTGIHIFLLPNMGQIIVTSWLEKDRSTWLHASISFRSRLPTYADIVMLKEGVFGDDRECYQVFPKKKDHINIHPNTLHLWGRADGEPILPDFGVHGTI